MNDADRPLVVLSRSPAGLQDIDIELTAAGLAIRYLERADAVETFEQLMQVAFGAVLGSERVDGQLLASCANLRVIARTGVGTDGIDIDAATRAGVLVTTTPGVNEQTVAEHTLALMLAAVRRITQLDRDLRAGEWLSARSRYGSTVRGATVGIVGLGSIGATVADLATSLGAYVLACDPLTQSRVYPMVGLHALLRESDIVSLHVPLTRETANMIGPTELRMMRSTAVLVNTARGGLVDEEALLAALEEGEIALAALDVRASEPPSNTRLTVSCQVVSTPHVAGFSPATITQMRRLAVESVVAVFRGRQPLCAVNSEAVNVSIRGSPQPAAPNQQ